MGLRYEVITLFRLADTLTACCLGGKQEELPSDTMRSATLQDGVLNISFDSGFVTRHS